MSASSKNLSKAVLFGSMIELVCFVLAGFVYLQTGNVWGALVLIFIGGFAMLGLVMKGAFLHDADPEKRVG